MSTRSTRIAMLAVTLASASLLAACSSSSSSSTTTTASSSSSTTVAASAGGSKDVAGFTSQLTGGRIRTYKATYSLTAPTYTGTLVVERMPVGNVRFDVSTSTQSVAVIKTSGTNYICELTKTPTTCLSGIPDPVTGVEALVDPSQVVTNLQAAAALGKRNVTFASQTIAGEPSTCATITSGRTGTYCVTDQGVLASATGANGSVTLTAFTTTVPASDFSPPAGATVETIP